MSNFYVSQFFSLNLILETKKEQPVADNEQGMLILIKSGFSQSQVVTLLNSPALVFTPCVKQKKIKFLLDVG